MSDGKKVKHLVLLPFHQQTSATQKEFFFEKLNIMLKELNNTDATCAPIQLKIREYSSPEGLNKSCNFLLEMDFISEASRNCYLNHPLHTKFVKVTMSKFVNCERLIAFDYLY